MSGQAKASRVRAEVRHREQVARLIGQALYGSQPCLPCDGTGVFGSNTGSPRPCDGCGGTRLRANHAARQYLDGSVMFDVHASRAFGERLIFEGEQACATWAVFVDWCRDHGLGPDACAGTTKRGRDLGDGMYEATFSPGGWPFGLAAAWARGPGRVTCSECKGSGTTRLCVVLYPGDSLDQPCPTCRASGKVEGPRPQPGDSQIRMGRRLLAALDGQRSECQACIGPSATIETATATVRRIAATHDGPVQVRTHPEAISRLRYTQFGEADVSCLSWISARYDATFVVDRRPPCCHGTGHNLGGVLPEIEWPAVVRRKAIDGYRVASPDEPHHFDRTRQRIIDSGVNISTVAPRDPHRLVDTRSVPRGHHRALESADMVAASNRCTRNVSVNDGESLSLWAPVSMLWAPTAPEVYRRPGHSYDDRQGRCPRWWRAEQARANPRGWSVDFAALVSAWDGQFTIATGSALDRAALGVQVARADGETDAELRARITARIQASVRVPTLADIRTTVRGLPGVTSATVDTQITDPELPLAHIRVTYTGAADPSEVEGIAWQMVSPGVFLDVQQDPGE
jgi:hypothetical protein